MMDTRIGSAPSQVASRRFPLAYYTLKPRPSGIWHLKRALVDTPISVFPEAAVGERSAESRSEAGQSTSDKAMTPRQRRLAQQRRKWEEQQQQQQQQQQQRKPVPVVAPKAAAPSPHTAHTADRQLPASRPKQQQRTQRDQRKSPALQQQHSTTATTASAAATSAAAAAAAPLSPADAPGAAAGAAPGCAAAAACRTPPTDLARAGPNTSPHPARRPAAAREAAPLPAPAAVSTPLRPPAGTSAAHGKRGREHPDGVLAPAEDLAEGRQQQPAADWPSLFAEAPGQRDPAGPAPSDIDWDALTGAQLVALAEAWVQELMEWETNRGSLVPASASPASSSHRPSTPSLPSPSTSLSSPPAATPPSAPSWRLPSAAASRLSQLTAAVDARVTHGSLGHQELADLAWSVAHYNRDHSMRVLHPAMDVPFSVVPQFMPELRLEDFMEEVELRRDVIYLDDGSRAVEESRLTGWQSAIGATFKYSGKEMQPQAGGLSPHVQKVRDALQALTGVSYDSVLVNYYADGKCGMRYHVDPLYGRWTPNSAVVSLGATRSFIFRAISDFNTRWQYRVRNGDVVLMFDDCQERLQHCVRVERRAEDAGPRMSLVFKERLRGPDGEYLAD